MLSFVTLVLFAGRSFGWLAKGAVEVVIGVEMLNRRMGFGPKEGLLTPTMRFHIIHNSTEQIGRDVALVCRMFDDLKEFEGMELLITESEAVQLRAMMNSVSVAVGYALEHGQQGEPSLMQEHHEQATMCVRALVVFLARLPDHRRRG